jgi:hypothetical protein
MEMRVASTLYAPRATQRYALRSPSQRSADAPPLPGSPPSPAYDPSKSLYSRRDEATPRVGFGEGTISGPTAAVRTIGSNMAAARSLVPSVEELRAEARDRIEAKRREMAAEAVSRMQQQADTAARASSVPARDSAKNAEEVLARLDEAAARSRTPDRTESPFRGSAPASVEAFRAALPETTVTPLVDVSG